jgi:hypothetical protein
VKRGEWAAHLANALGNSSPDALTLNWVSAWLAGEGTKARYNPLATCKKMPGSTPFNPPACVQNYTDHQTGIDATVKTLMHGYPGYEDMREGIRTNDPERAMRGLYAAPWGTNGSKVDKIWRSEDTRDKELLSHPTGDQVDTGGDQTFIGGAIDYATGEMAEASNVTEMVTGIDVTNTAARAALGGLGVLFLILAIGLTVRTYVPTSQIVKTIATVAA